MSAKSKSPKKLSVPEIINLIQTSADEAWYQLIDSRHFINNKAEKFWVEFDELDIPGLMKLYPEHLFYYPKIAALHRFYILDRVYQEEIKKVSEEIIRRNPTVKALVEASYLVLDLGSTHVESDNLVSYSLESLEALKNSLSSIIPKLNSESQCDFSLELFDCVRLLLRLQTDYCLLHDFLDIYIYADFFLKKIQDGPGFNLEVLTPDFKNQNIYIREQIKTQFKRSFKRNESQEEISKKPTFKKFDHLYKSEHGLATMIVSEGLKVSSTEPGTTYLEDFSGILGKITSENQEEQAMAQV